MNWIQTSIAYLVYGNVWIAMCALLMVFQTQIVLSGKMTLGPVPATVFFFTWSLYSAHRIFGFNKLSPRQHPGKYQFISLKKRLLVLSSIIGALLGILGLLFVSLKVILYFIPVFLISASYVLPVFGKGRRLRDISWLKIFYISFCWSWTTVIIPSQALDVSLGQSFLFFAEKFLFIFAITLPFDIVDMEIDRRQDVNTLPVLFGRNVAYLLSFVALFIMWLVDLGMFLTDAISIGYLSGISFSIIIVSVLILVSRHTSDDYFYGGVLDGTMILQFTLVYLFWNIF